jgi:hypothetical protein
MEHRMEYRTGKKATRPRAVGNHLGAAMNAILKA